MKIAGEYSFNCGASVLEKRYPHLLKEITEIIAAVDAEQCRTKRSKEKTMKGRMLLAPEQLKEAFAEQFSKREWKKVHIPCEYSNQYYTRKYQPPATTSQKKTRLAQAFREMDFVKEKLGVEVQFGKYAFMVYNVCAKMTIFHNRGIIDAGVEIVPVQAFTRQGGSRQMSTGVSYFEQIVWDLDHRGVSDIDIPVVILGGQ